MTRVVTLLLVILVAGGCGRSAPPATFSSTFESKEAAAQAVLDALWTRDTDRLRALTITESEFRKHIWPSLPMARADIGAAPDYTWAELAQKNAGFLGGVISDYGGRRLVLRQVVFRGAVTNYDDFTTHGKTELMVEVEGRPERLRLFGSMVESNGRWKIYSYIVD